MTSFDFVVKGRALVNGEPTPCCIGVLDGKIAAMKKVIDSEESKDFGDALLLPAAVDMHVHLREPGKVHKEDFFTGTMAAAFGGVSCVADMPNTVPMTSDAATLREKLLLGEAKANVDFGLWGLLAPGSDLEALRAGTVGYKFFMSETAGSNGAPVASWTGLAKGAGPALVAVHPEHPEEIIAGEPRDLEEHNKLRSPAGEARGVADAGALFGNLHLCHVSSRAGVEALAALRMSRAGGRLTAEATPHHLFLNFRSDLGTLSKVNPPLRAGDDQVALWDALTSGAIDFVSSDHAPHTLDEKRVDFAEAPSGLPGVETGFPLMLRAAREGRIPLVRCVGACCTGPAERLGLRKGKLEVGLDADIVAVDMTRVTKIKGDDLHSKCGWTPFEGREAIFPRMTMVRGNVVALDGNVVAERCGQAVPISSPRNR